MKLTESPRDRFRTVTLGLFAHKSGPNVIAGAAITAILQAVAGFSPWWWAALTVAVWLAWVLIYAVADEVQQRIEEQRNRLLAPESQYYGIE